MTPLFKKLNLGSARVLHVLQAPASFEPELQALEGVTVMREVRGPVVFVLAFVQTLEAIEQAIAAWAPAAEGDAVIWMVYPKASSKTYRCEFNRDTGWQAMGRAGYEPVRQVAIDEDWSALRFRQVAFIKTMTRHPDGALTTEGREKARQHRKG